MFCLSLFCPYPVGRLRLIGTWHLKTAVRYTKQRHLGWSFSRCPARWSNQMVRLPPARLFFFSLPPRRVNRRRRPLYLKGRYEARAGNHQPAPISPSPAPSPSAHRTSSQSRPAKFRISRYAHDYTAAVPAGRKQRPQHHHRQICDLLPSVSLNTAEQTPSSRPRARGTLIPPTKSFLLAFSLPSIRTPPLTMSRSNPPNNASASRKISFNVSEQYDIQDVVGEGAYGVVW